MSTDGIKSDIVGMWSSIALMRVNELQCTYGDSQQKCFVELLKLLVGKRTVTY